MKHQEILYITPVINQIRIGYSTQGNLRAFFHVGWKPIEVSVPQKGVSHALD
jgi:hypothetical protein